MKENIKFTLKIILTILFACLLTIVTVFSLTLWLIPVALFNLAIKDRKKRDDFFKKPIYGTSILVDKIFNFID